MCLKILKTAVVNYLIYVDDFYNYFVKQAKKENIHIRRSYILRTFKIVKVIEGKKLFKLKIF